MATIIDSVSITGMKHSDFEQLEEIFKHFSNEGIYWGRKDYWDKRMERLQSWLDEVEVATRNCIIKEEE